MYICTNNLLYRCLIPADCPSPEHLSLSLTSSVPTVKNMRHIPFVLSFGVIKQRVFSDTFWTSGKNYGKAGIDRFIRSGCYFLFNTKTLQHSVQLCPNKHI